MRSDGIDTVIDDLLRCDPAVSDRDEVLAALGRLNRVSGWAEAARFQCKRRLDELNTAGQSETATSALTDHGGRSGKDAKATTDREQVCSNHPELEDALATGEVSTAHLDVIAGLTKRLSDIERSDLDARWDQVEAWAEHDYVSELERKLKNLIAEIKAAHAPADEAAELDRQRDESHMKRWVDKPSGMHITQLVMDPLRDAAFHTVAQRHLGRLRQNTTGDVPFGSLQIDAVIAAMTSGNGEPGERLTEVSLHIDIGSLTTGRHANTICETVDGVSVPISTAQRLCCEAVIAAVLIEPDGTTRRLCAEQRTANRQQRRALAAMYATCAHPHCEIEFSACRIHHVIWWSNGGKTILENLLPVCERHHHLVHEGGWNLTLDPDRTTTWIRPDGQIWCRSGINRTPQPGAIRAGPAPPGSDPRERPGSTTSTIETVAPVDWQQPSLC